MHVFLYGTLRSPKYTTDAFDVEFVGRARMEGVMKLGNNLIPSGDDSVKGNLFKGDIQPIDSYEEKFGYEALTAEVTDSSIDGARFYAKPYPETASGFMDVEVSLRE